MRSRKAPGVSDRGKRGPARIERVIDTTAEARIGANVEVQPDGCWHYGKPDRYSLVLVAGRRFKAHRWFYETLVGPIPDGKMLHHTCQVPGCVNPEHLMPVTAAEHKAEHRKLAQAS